MFKHSVNKHQYSWYQTQYLFKYILKDKINISERERE